MSGPSFYYTISAPQEDKIEIKGSRFLAVALPVNSEAEAKEHLQFLRKKYFDATHLCYAYRITAGKETVRTFDAGEPNFTAGKPIFNAILSGDLTNVMVVVARWFGGTKLGKANLSRAYHQAAKRVLRKAAKVKRVVTQKLKFQIRPEQYNMVNSILVKNQAEVLSQTFDSEWHLEALIPQTCLETLKDKLRQATSGKIQFD